MTTSHKPLPVAGYTEQPEDKVTAVNVNKEMEEVILRRLDKLQGNARVDQRWLAIARTDIERGFMAFNRAIFQPQRIKLPEEE